VDLNLSSFAWPAAVAICVIAFFGIFRKAIADRISNISHIKRDGIEMRTPGGQKTIDSKKYIEDELQSPGLEEVSVYVEPAIQHNLEQIRRSFSKNQYKSADEKVQHLERFLARLLTDNYHLFTFITIFGSQFRFLNQLNPRTLVGYREAEQFFIEEKERWPDAHADRSFEEWIGYLIDKRLIARSERGFSITDVGVDLLKFRIQWKINEPSVF